MSKHVRKKRKVDTHTDKTAATEPTRFPAANEKLTDVLSYLKNGSRKNFTEEKMKILLSNFEDTLIKHTSHHTIKITSSVTHKTISTHNGHGKKASSFNGDYDRNFLKDLYNMLEESGIYKHYFSQETNPETNHHDNEILGDRYDSSDHDC